MRHQETIEELEALNLNNPQITSSLASEKVYKKPKPITYAEMKSSQDNEYKKILKVYFYNKLDASETFKNKTIKKTSDDDLRKYENDGLGKFNTLKNLIRVQNTRARIDQFEAL